VGSMRTEGWVQESHVQEKSLDVKYLICLQWSMAQFTPGASPVQPVTPLERLYCVSVLVLALIVATCFISNITSTLSSAWAMRRAESTQALLLRKFLRQHNISRGLASRVTRYIDCVLEIRQNKVHPSRVQHLSLLSGPLNVELQSAVQEPTLFMCNFFQMYKSSSVWAFREVCTTALEQTNMGKKDMVFSHKTEAKYVYFLNVGSLVYRLASAGAHNDIVGVSKLEAGSYCCENALWIPWQHAGDMKALSDCSLTLLNASKFCDITCRDPTAHHFSRQYCLEFIERIWQAATFDPFAVTDLQLKIRIIGTESTIEGGASHGGEDAQLAPAAKDLRDAEDMEAELIAFSDSSDEEGEDAASTGGTWSSKVNFGPLTATLSGTPRLRTPSKFRKSRSEANIA